MQHYFQWFSLLEVFTSLIILRMILFHRQTKLIIMGFSQGDFIRSEKVELKKMFLEITVLKYLRKLPGNCPS